MKAYIIRGQGSGPRVDRVFLRPPTEAEMREALRDELDKHGIRVVGDEITARELFVVAQEIEIVGGDDFVANGGTVADLPRAAAALSGQHTERELEAIIAARNEAPSATGGVGAADAGAIAFHGFATVTNPSG